MTMEIRARLTIPGIPYDRPDLWEPFIERLEADAAGHGPVLAWTEDWQGAIIIMSAEAQSPSLLAEACFGEVTRALQAVGLDDTYPAAIELEPAEDLEPAPA